MVYLSKGYITWPHLRVSVGSASFLQQIFTESQLCAGTTLVPGKAGRMMQKWPSPGPREPEFGRWGGKQACPQMTNNQGCEFLRHPWRKAFLRAAQEEQ